MKRHKKGPSPDSPAKSEPPTTKKEVSLMIHHDTRDLDREGVAG